MVWMLRIRLESKILNLFNFVSWWVFSVRIPRGSWGNIWQSILKQKWFKLTDGWCGEAFCRKEATRFAYRTSSYGKMAKSVYELYNEKFILVFSTKFVSYILISPVALELSSKIAKNQTYFNFAKRKLFRKTLFWDSSPRVSWELINTVTHSFHATITLSAHVFFLEFLDKTRKSPIGLLKLRQCNLLPWAQQMIKPFFFCRSQDDPFLLYAAMHSGPNTGFVSRDQMRGHAFKLSDPKLKQLFYRWQQRNQYDFLFMTNDGKAIVKVGCT